MITEKLQMGYWTKSIRSLCCLLWLNYKKGNIFAFFPIFVRSYTVKEVNF